VADPLKEKANEIRKKYQSEEDAAQAQEATRYARSLGSELKEDAGELSEMRGKPEYKQAWAPEFDRVMQGGEPYEPDAGLLGTYTPGLAREAAADDSRGRLNATPVSTIRALAMVEAGEAARYLRNRNIKK
jgi:hypothetical protein